MSKQFLENQIYTGERPLFNESNLSISNCSFADGESPLKECESIDIDSVSFKWKYPLWYCKDITVTNSTWYDMARAGVWYTDNITICDSQINAPKNFRKCNNIKISNSTIPFAEETLWNCRNVTLDDVVAKGPYFAMNCSDVSVSRLMLTGDYSFDGCTNVLVSGSKLISKDAFWNTENVIVTGSYISGEYLGWNAKNLTLIDCTIESLQGMCYIDNLVMKNCKLVNTTLAFEYSSVDVDLCSGVDSVFNPKSGTITCDYIGSLIIEKDKVDPSKTKITTRK